MGLKRVKTQTKTQLINPIRRKKQEFGVQDEGYDKLFAERESRKPTGTMRPDASGSNLNIL